ncbi:MAG TPA: carboxypeptidase regulatory-like domain-containing protein [Firmicutes bacterium]|nr:carboxypeptidase regulatory-like domain-containing protein [Bacillota bacterium]
MKRKKLITKILTAPALALCLSVSSVASAEEPILAVSDTIELAAASIPAFPGAEGAGMHATGGRGGSVYHVTNLNDSGAGSLRDAVSSSNRIVVFDVAGTISLKSDINCQSNITIAGQTAPGGKGITLKGGKFGMGGDNIIVRFISSRPGEKGSGSGDYDAWGGSKGSNSIIDHCSIGWANDEQFGLYSQNMNQTVQYSIIGPSNCVSYHSKGAHGFGAMFGKGQNSWHHNLICHSLSRNFRGKVVGTNSMDFVNNVIYDWGYQTAYGTLGHINYVNNTLKAGPSTKGGYRFINISSGTAPENYRFYMTGNRILNPDGSEYSSAINSDNWNGGINYGSAGYTEEDYRSDSPFSVSSSTGADVSVAYDAESAEDSYENVLSYAGAAAFPADNDGSAYSFDADTSRNKIDAQVLYETRTGTGSLTGGRDFSTVTDDAVLSAIDTYGINFCDYDEYYPEAVLTKDIIDSDNDGMPDEWEAARGLDPNDASDATGDYLGEGYNNIEYYINEDMDLSALTSPNIYYAKTPVRLTFNVTSSNGTPIEGAEITMDSYSVATDSNGAAHIDVIAGDYTYTIRKQGYSTQRDVAVSVEDTTAQTINITMQESDSYSVNAVTKTADGAIIRPEETVAEYKFAETSDYSFNLDDGYKEDITFDGKVYEMDFDASDTTKFTVEDDTLLTLIFKEKVTPGEGDTPIYSTNLGPNGYSSADENHGYTPSENASVSEYISDGSKYSVYRLGEDSVTRTLNGSYSDMVIEFDMIYTGDTSTSVGGDVVGLTVYNGNNQGTTAGIRFTGSLTPQICAFAGGSNYQTSTSVSSGTKLHYVLNYSGGTLTMSVANADTGEILTDDLVCGMRNSVGTAERPIDRIAFNRGNGSGTTPIGLSNVKIYQIGGPTEAVYPYSSHAAAAIGGETKFAPRSFKHLTDAGNIKIDLSGALTYAVKNQDGTEYAGNEVSIGNDGVVTVSEDAAKSYYRLDYIYNGKTVNTLDFRTADSEYGTFYSSAENGKLDDFVCGGGTDAMVSFSKSGWTLNQTNSIDGAEMYRDFNPVYGGTAELSFDFKMGAQRADGGAGDYYKNYSFEIQFLDAEYDSEGNAINVLGGKEDLSGDNILFALSKVYSTTEREEVQYYSRGADKTYLSDTGTLIGESTRLHITNTTTWSIKVTFDFDNQTADMTILDSDGNGYAYSDIEIDADSFKTLRVVSKVDGVNAVTWKPVITNLTYSSTAYSPAEPTEIGAYGQSGTAYVSVEAPDNGGADITEYVVSCEDPTGNVTTYSGATSPVAITGVTEGTYNFKASVKNAVGESNLSDASASLTFSGINILHSEHGSVTTASALGAEGEEVKLSVDPDPGYMLDTLTITDAGGGEIDYDGIQSIFTMPGQAVNITATFTEAPIPEGFSSLGEDQISALSSKDATLYIAVYDAQNCLENLTEQRLTANEAYIFALPQAPENGSVNAYIWDGETYEPLYDDLSAALEQGIE